MNKAASKTKRSKKDNRRSDQGLRGGKPGTAKAASVTDYDDGERQ